MLAVLPLMAFSIVIGTHYADSPDKVAAVPLSGRLVVANLRDESLSFFSVTNPADALTLALPGPPHELLTSEGRIYATLGRGNMLVEVDGHGGGVTRTLALEGEPHGLALDPGQPMLLVTLDKGAALVRVAIVDFRSTGSESTGGTPHTVAAQDGAIYITDSGDNQIREAVSKRTAPTGDLPESVAIAGSYVVTANSAGASLSVFDRGSLAAVATIPLNGHPVRVIRIDEGHVAVALGDASAIAIVDLGRRTVTRTIKTDARPDGLCFAGNDRSQIAVVSNGGNSVRVYRIADGHQMAAFGTAEGPGACLWLP